MIAPIEVTPLAGRRILFGITKSNWGGAQAYVTMLATAAKGAGADVAVMAGGADGRGSDAGALFTTLAHGGIRTIPLSCIQRDLGLRSEWQALHELIAVLRRERPDVLHLNSSKMGVLGAVAGRVAGVRHIVFTSHGWPHLESRSILWKLFAWTGAWLTVMLASKVICVSDTDLRHAPVLMFRDKLAHIGNGIAPFALMGREDARTALAKRDHTMLKHATWLFMLAELHPNKGIGTAVRALAALSDAHPDAALVVCGEGQDRARLTALAEELGVSSRVYLIGFVEGAREYLQAADIFLMPSYKEGHPIALLEAGIAALPSIATKVGGIPDIITDQKTGLFMPRGNTHILAKAISYLLREPAQAAAIGAALKAKVETEYTERGMTDRTFALY